jgi:hypothetical protein
MPAGMLITPRKIFHPTFVLSMTRLPIANSPPTSQYASIRVIRRTGVMPGEKMNIQPIISVRIPQTKKDPPG